MRILLLHALVLATATAAAAVPNFANPVVRQRADPHLTLHPDGWYYFAATVPEYDRLELRRAKTLSGLAAAETTTIWRQHATGPMGSHIWAPELHFITDKWYVYFAAGGAEKDKVWQIRIYVLENSAANPLEGTWIERGQLKTNWESFALDATTFAHRGRRYLAWAQKDPNIKGNTNLYLARSYREIQGDPLHDPNRHTRLQPLTWRADGTPDFGVPWPDPRTP
jgi:GH43 family beta-xylosidase